MPFSSYLDGARKNARKLVTELDGYFDYVSILGSDVRETSYRADRNISAAQDVGGECGFVIKMNKGAAFYEYSFDDITGDVKALAERIIKEAETSDSLKSKMISTVPPVDEPMKKDFVRETDYANYSDAYLLDFCRDLSKELVSASDKVLNGVVIIRTLSVSKLFITKNRELSQCYGWANGYAIELERRS